MTDALGNLVRFELLPGHRFDTVGVAPLIEGIDFGGLIADKAFDSNTIIADLNARGAKIVISQHPRRARTLPLDRELYKWRHLIENFFCKLKEFKRIAMRADKTDQSFSAMIYLAAAVINSPEGDRPGVTRHVAKLISTRFNDARRVDLYDPRLHLLPQGGGEHRRVTSRGRRRLSRTGSRPSFPSPCGRWPRRCSVGDRRGRGCCGATFTASVGRIESVMTSSLSLRIGDARRPRRPTARRG